MANRNFPNGKSIYIPHVKPVLLDCSFVVDSTNGNGLGLRSLKAPYIDAVYMHTTATPSAGNPNPIAGYIVIKLSDNYYRYLGGFAGSASPVTGSPAASGLTIGQAYVITVLGSSTPAQWAAVGLPLTQTAAIGSSFIATATSVAGGGMVQATMTTGITSYCIVGDPNQNNNNFTNGATGGMTIIVATYSSGVLTAPANGATISMSFYMDDSSVIVTGAPNNGPTV